MYISLIALIAIVAVSFFSYRAGFKAGQDSTRHNTKR